jgi:DNA-binding transcriptional MerR regulator
VNDTFSAEQLAQRVNEWCQRHSVVPASGQAGETMTVRNIRYYRALGLLDPPSMGGGLGFTEKHQLQLVAIRLLQAQGLPLNRIQELMFGRTVEELKQIERQGLAELNQTEVVVFRPAINESWCVTPLNQEFMLVSRRGRRLPSELRERFLAMLESKKKETGQGRSVKGKN